MQGYTKLFSRILDSTVWRENNPTRLLWITLLALSDQDGIVHCTIPGLADRARISLEECEYALQRFHQPDKYSWSKEKDGRRIETVEGGWFIINHEKFRAMMSVEEKREKTRLRVARWRERNAKSLQNVTSVTSNASNDIAYTDTKAINPPTPLSNNSNSKPNGKERKLIYCPDCQDNGTTVDGELCHCKRGQDAAVAREVMAKIKSKTRKASV